METSQSATQNNALNSQHLWITHRTVICPNLHAWASLTLTQNDLSQRNLSSKLLHFVIIWSLQFSFANDQTACGFLVLHKSNDNFLSHSTWTMDQFESADMNKEAVEKLQKELRTKWSCIPVVSAKQNKTKLESRLQLCWHIKQNKQLFSN